MFRILLTLLSFIFLINSHAQPTGGLNVAFEKFSLPNGLDVVFHIDRSDPIVAVALTAHVGSAREMRKHNFPG